MHELYGNAWAITAAKLAELDCIVRQHGRGRNVQAEQTPRRAPTAFGQADFGNDGPGYAVVGNVAVIPVRGTIVARASAWSWLFGDTSHDEIRLATRAALKDGKVEAIVYDIDSPGGVVSGMPEAADEVFAAKKQKPTVGVANFTAASAAYWYLSQCGEAVCAPSGTVGSIGVLMLNIDQTRALEMSGVRVDVVANEGSPFKSERYPQVPVTPEALADLKKTCNLHAGDFVSAVARGRGVTPATVERDFGKGRMLTSGEAQAFRMVDRVATLETVIHDLARPTSSRARRDLAAQAVARGLPIRFAG